MIPIKNTKGCGCLIGTAVIESEKARRKNELRIKGINTKLKSIKDKKRLTKLKAEKKWLMADLKGIVDLKKNMKKRFDNYVKNSGYVPPKLKRD